MFKKPIAVASQHKLSGADSKKFIKQVRQFFPKASDTVGRRTRFRVVLFPVLAVQVFFFFFFFFALVLELGSQDISKLLPSKDNIYFGKVASPSRVVMYMNENGVPMFIDLNGKGEIVPTVFSLWLVPTLLPAFVCKHDDVSHFVLSGKRL